MFKKKYTLLFLNDGTIVSASSFKFDDKFVVVSAINFQTLQFANTQYISYSNIAKIVEYSDLATFQLIVQGIMTPPAPVAPVEPEQTKPRRNKRGSKTK